MTQDTQIPTRTVNPAYLVDDALIEALVHTFYDRVRVHPALGPVFNSAISNWEPHLATMVNFWSSVMNTSGRYKGQPMPKHAALSGVTPAHFTLWLGLFRDTASELCTPEIAARFAEKSELIAKSLQLGMFGLPGLRQPVEKTNTSTDP